MRSRCILTRSTLISAAKNELKNPKEYEEIAAGVFMEKVAQIYPRYQTKLRQNNAMDFDDLLFNAVLLFKKPSGNFKGLS